MLWRGKATRLCSPTVERAVCEAAPEQNYRPAACAVSRWLGARITVGLIWLCVQVHGARLVHQLQRHDPSPPASRTATPAVITELDATWLKRQRRHRQPGQPRHLPVHFGLHYTGRVRRYQTRGSTSVRLVSEEVLATTQPPAVFGRPASNSSATRTMPPRCAES